MIRNRHMGQGAACGEPSCNAHLLWMNSMAIEQVSPTDYIKLAELWEDSVRTTHDFLSDADIAAMRPRLLAEWLPAVALRVYRGSGDRILGFIGLSEEKVEMLFVASNARGRGIGRRL